MTSRARWYWVPVGPDVRTVRYSPALVAFVGGPGFSLTVSGGGGGNVGWFPLAPRDPFVPWWGARARETNLTSVTNVTYVNRTYVTVVNQNTFISGGPIATNTIRDPRVLREISTAPILRGPLPIVPVASSIRVSTKSTGSAPRPPAAALTRPVVTHLAPAPAPAIFREKTNLIRENRGAPVDPAQAAHLSPVSRAIQPTRSVVVEKGRVGLTPKKDQGARPAPVPVTRGARPGQAPRKQDAEQQKLEARKAQDADAARKKQQQDIDTRKQHEAEDARQKQQQDIEARKQHEAEGARQKQQQEPRAKEQKATEEQKAAQPKPTAADQKKEKDNKDKEKDKKDQPGQKDQS